MIKGWRVKKVQEKYEAVYDKWAGEKDETVKQLLRCSKR